MSFARKHPCGLQGASATRDLGLRVQGVGLGEQGLRFSGLQLLCCGALPD